ncbi:CBO0543 family protein [Paenibacillus xanthanilyticus]|uniref:CBO0543 family protein n=1 Tax=Paenibacillus xanthanilyticus TaxID=1783531 RepID=A0ABV8JZE8_9BACL
MQTWRETMLLMASDAIGIMLLALVPKERRKEAAAIFLFQQLPAWLLGLAVVELGWISYPVREYQKASHTSFSFEFLLLPTIAVYYNLLFPVKATRWTQLLYTLAFGVAITVPEYIIMRTTRLIHYIHWDWYWTLFSVMGVLVLSRLFAVWFFGSARPRPLKS